MNWDLLRQECNQLFSKYAWKTTVGTFCLVLSFSAWAASIDYGQVKGEALNAVLKPLPPKEPAEALRCLEVIPGFTVEYVAHEPLVLDPVAAAIDENGVLFVAEDADYPYRPEPGQKPKGRIRVLKDNDGDGYCEESHLFADGLLWPAGVAPWKGGVFVTAPPDVWYLKDTNGDFVADVREKIFTGFGTGGSQYIMNNLQWGLDHKIYAAVAGNGGMVRRADQPAQPPVSVARRDFRFDPVTREFDSISGGKQFGNTFDDWGNRFLSTQDTPVYQVVFPQPYLERNPLLAAPETTRRLVPSGAPVFRTSPVEAWRAIRSSRRLLVEKGSPDASGVSHHVLDGVAGTTVYRSGAFPAEFYGNVFSGDAQNNLVHRRSLVPDGVLFRSDRLDQNTEFLRSTDNWFRPVNFLNAPDGTLYVLDLAREVLEAVHIPMDVVSHLDLTSGRDRGRIFRVQPVGYRRPAQPRMSEFTTAQLVAALESPHAWWRESAHRLIYERGDSSAHAPLRRLLKQSPSRPARLHALWSLQGLGGLSDEDVLTGLADSWPPIRENAIQLAEPRLAKSEKLFSRCLELTGDPAARVRFQLAFTLGESSDPRAADALVRLARRDASDDFIRTAILSSSYPIAARMIAALEQDAALVKAESGRQLLGELARIVGGRNRQVEILPLLETALATKSATLQRVVVAGLSDGLHGSGAELRSLANSLEPTAARRLEQLYNSAIQSIINPEASVTELTAMLRLLENARFETAASPVLGLLDRFPPAAVQGAAVRTLWRLDAPDFAESIVARWRQVGSEARREILTALSARKDRADVFLAAMEQGRILPGEVDPVTRSNLRHHANASIRARASALFGDEQSGERASAILQFRAALTLKGDLHAGRELYGKLCSACHRLNGLGAEVGPNLALAASRTPDELLTHILDPNRAVDPAYVQYNVEAADGEIYSGLLVADNPASVSLKGPNFAKTIPRGQIKKISSDGLSLMPVGLEEGLAPQDLANLLSFLLDSQYDYGTSGHSYSGDVPERK